MSQSRRSSDEVDSDGCANCGCGLFLLLVNIFIGAWSVNYLLMFFLEKNIPWIGAALIGLFAGEVSIPVAVVVYILHYFGVL